MCKDCQLKNDQDNNQPQKRFPKLTCEYVRSQNIGKCEKTTKGFNNVEFKDYQDWDDHFYNEETGQNGRLIMVSGPICQSCEEWAQKHIMQQQNTYKNEYCYMCGTQG